MDTSSKAAVVKLVLPHVPYLMRTALMHTLWLSPTSSKWTLKTEMAVKLIRAILAAPSPHGALHRQQVTLKDPGIKGKMWISKVQLPVDSTDDMLNIFCDLVDSVKTHPDATYTKPSLSPVEAEWTGYRPDADANRPRPDLSEPQHFERLMADTKSPLTILYLHGGAFVMMDPASHRNAVSHLCELTGGRALSIRYRLAPQHPFPAALLDAFVTYLSLLYPPPNSLHKAVEAKHIIFAGDSAGAALCLSLTQFLLLLNSHHKDGIFRLHGKEVKFPIPMPAGVAAVSPWLDLTHSFPSWKSNQKYDYLPDREDGEWLKELPADDIWPSDPPRGDLYCDISMLCHPLASPAMASNWAGAPPMWLAYGEEMLLDEGKQVAQLAAEQGVTVVWESWEGMCHCFGMVLWGSPIWKHFFKQWSGFCNAVCGADGSISQGDAQDQKSNQNVGMPVETKGTFYEAKTLKPQEVDLRTLAVLSEVEAKDRMRQATQRRQQAPGEAANILPKVGGVF